MREFRDRVAVITGGASGIGRATADRLAREGMRIVLADVEDGALEKARLEMEEAGADVLAVRTDVSEAAEVERLARASLDHFGAVHVLFNNAGVAVTGPLWAHSLEDWQWVLNVNLWGVVHGIRSFVPILLEQGGEGHIVSTASMAGLMSNPGLGVYNVTKFGVVTLSETLYMDLKLQGSSIGVSVLCPGFIRTRIMDSARNRPGDLSRDPPSTEASPLATALEAAMRPRIEAGYEATMVAQYVFEGIRDDRFYLLPAQQQITAAMHERCRGVIEARNPQVPNVLTDL